MAKASRTTQSRPCTPSARPGTTRKPEGSPGPGLAKDVLAGGVKVLARALTSYGAVGLALRLDLGDGLGLGGRFGGS